MQSPVVGLLGDQGNMLASESIPPSLLLPVAALRWWIRTAAQQGDALTDAEVHAAVSGIVCSFEPAFADSRGHGDPMTRSKGTTSVQIKNKAAAFSEANQQRGWTGSFDNADGTRMEFFGKLNKHVAVLESNADYAVIPDPGGNGEPDKRESQRRGIFKGRDMAIVHRKPAWMAPAGLRRLQQWRIVLRGVEDVCKCMQLQLPSTKLVVDPVDFLYSIWVATSSGEASAAEPRVEDPVRSNITARCSTITRAGGIVDSKSTGVGVAVGERVLRLFDAVLGAANSGPIRDMVDHQTCCLLDSSAPVEVPDAWDASDSDSGGDGGGDGDGGGNGDGDGDGSCDGACRAALDEMLAGAADLCANSETAAVGMYDDVWCASVRLLSVISASERERAVSSLEPAAQAQLPDVISDGDVDGSCHGSGRSSGMWVRGRLLWGASLASSLQ